MPVHTQAPRLQDVGQSILDLSKMFGAPAAAQRKAEAEAGVYNAQGQAAAAKALLDHIVQNPDDWGGALLAARQAAANVQQTKTQTGALAQDTEFKGQDQRKAQSVVTKNGAGFGANQLPSQQSNELGNRREDWNEKNLATNNLLQLMATGVISKEEAPKYMAAMVSQDPRAAASEMMQRKVMATNQTQAEAAGAALRDNLKKVTDPATKQALVDQAAKRYSDSTGQNLFQNINASSNLPLLKELNGHDQRFITPAPVLGPDGKPLPVAQGSKPTAEGQPSAASGFLDKIKTLLGSQELPLGSGPAVKAGLGKVGDVINSQMYGTGGAPSNKAVKKGTPQLPDQATNDQAPLPKDEPPIIPGVTSSDPNRMSELIAEAQKPDQGSETDIHSMARALTDAGVNPAQLSNGEGAAGSPTPLFADNDNRVVNPSRGVGAGTGPTPVQAGQIAQILGLSQPAAVAQTSNAPLAQDKTQSNNTPIIGGPDLQPLKPMQDDTAKNAIAAQGVQAQTLGPMLAAIIAQLNMGGKVRTT